jgi:hypothetical protein
VSRQAPGAVCAWWGICQDLAPLGWIASDPCASCVITVEPPASGGVRTTVSRAVSRALLGTDDGS